MRATRRSPSFLCAVPLEPVAFLSRAFVLSSCSLIFSVTTTHDVHALASGLARLEGELLANSAFSSPVSSLRALDELQQRRGEPNSFPHAFALGSLKTG